MLISKFGGNNNQKHIEDTEIRFGIMLPSQYREFLIKYNGGYTPNTTFKVGRISSNITGFYGFGDAQINFSEHNLDAWVVKQFFPIACDAFGNYIIIGLIGEKQGKIYFFDHEGGKFIFLTEDLKLFIKTCKSQKINEYARRSIKDREADLIARGRGHVITDVLRQTWQEEIDMYGNMVQERVFIG